MANFRLTPRRKPMRQLFHTEDCALSLLCRCCRAPVCERRLARADRLRMQRDLWPAAMTPMGARVQRHLQSFYFPVLSFSRLMGPARLAGARARNSARDRRVPDFESRRFAVVAQHAQSGGVEQEVLAVGRG